MTVNKVILVGNLGRDPELRTTQSGTAVANLSLATTERRKDRDGTWTDHTEWHRVTCFGKTAENVDRYCQKGKQLYVEGRLSTRKWQDKDGADRWTTEVVADVVRFLGGGQRDDRPDRSDHQAGGYGGGNDSGGGDEDIPFALLIGAGLGAAAAAAALLQGLAGVVA